MSHTSLINLSQHSTCGLRKRGHDGLQVALGKYQARFLSQVIIANGGYHTDRKSELRHMKSKVGRCATDLFTTGKYIPKYFTKTYNVFHIYIF